MPSWLPSFLVAALVVLVATPRLRLRALAAEVLDRSRSDRPEPVPAIGGVAVVLAVLAGLLFERHLGREGALLVLAAALLGGIGLLDDVLGLSRLVLLAAQFTAAAVAVLLGIRGPNSGSVTLNVVVTFLCIVAVTNAFTLIGRTDGLASGIVGVAAAGTFLLAAQGGQSVLRTVGVATAGACLTFFVFNRPPAWIAMGASGSLFLGFTLAVVSLSVGVRFGGAESLVVPAMLLGLPLLDLAVVRVRHHHLADALVARGAAESRAVTVLVGAQAVMVSLAVLSAASVLPIAISLLAGVVVLGALGKVAWAWPGEDQGEPLAGRRLRAAGIALILAVPVLCTPAVIAMVRAIAPARAGQATAKQAAAALESGDSTAAAAAFDRAAAQFGEAKRRLDGPLPNLATIVPVLSADVTAAKTVVSVGKDLSSAGSVLGGLAGPSTLPIRDGAVELDEVQALTPALVTASRSVERSEERLKGLQRAFLAPPLRQAVDELSTLLRDKAAVLAHGAETAQLLPTLLGEDQPRRYFIAFQNNTELRGTGGFIGNWGELEAERGHLRLGRFGRLRELQDVLMVNGPAPVPPALARRWGEFGISTEWQQVNVAPDFPSTAQVIDAMYARSGGKPVDGVIAIDPVGLSAMLALTGPVSVKSWPEPITSANVVDVTLVRAYERYPVEQDDQRVAFLADVARAVTEAFTTLDVGSARQLLSSFAPAVRGRHLMLWAKSQSAEQLIRDVGADGGIPSLQGDSLFVVNQNMSAHKIDTYLERHVRYEVALEPRGHKVLVSGHGEVSVTNALPSLDLPYTVVGPYLPEFQVGENRTYLSVYSPFLTGDVEVDGQRADAEAYFELDRPSRSVRVSVPAGETRTVDFSVRGSAKLGDRTWYRLDLLRQPVLNPDTYDLVVGVPTGWRIAEVRGAPAHRSNRRTTIHVVATRPETVWIRVEPTGMNRLWSALVP